MKVICPKCGHSFYVNIRGRPKGAGAHYASGIKKLSPLHIELLQILAIHGPSTKRRIGAILATNGRRVSGNSLSGRLSELLGLGLVKCYKTRVREVDPTSKKFRFISKPVWEITDDGIGYLIALDADG